MQFLVVISLVLGIVSGDDYPPLPRLNVQTHAISVSGIGAGASMATQFQVAFSYEIMGLGTIAGVPYLCPRYCPHDPGTYERAVSLIKLFVLSSGNGPVYDPYMKYLKNDRIWIFSGSEDSLVDPGNANNTELFYKLWVKKPSNKRIKKVMDIPAEYGQPTNNYGGNCSELNKQTFLNNCGYSAAFNLLNFIYDNRLTEPNSSYVATGELSTFYQGPFAVTSPEAQELFPNPFREAFAIIYNIPDFPKGPYKSRLQNSGYVYIPSACQNGTKACRLHIAFHGCLMNSDRIGDEYVRHAGYNEVADLNDIIILYPQTEGPRFGNDNEVGCWDWWGYTGKEYPFHQGPQMISVHLMLDHISGVTTGCREGDWLCRRRPPPP